MAGPTISLDGESIGAGAGVYCMAGEAIIQLARCPIAGICKVWDHGTVQTMVSIEHGLMACRSSRNSSPRQQGDRQGKRKRHRQMSGSFHAHSTSIRAEIRQGSFPLLFTTQSKQHKRSFAEHFGSFAEHFALSGGCSAGDGCSRGLHLRNHGSRYRCSTLPELT
jgi:hypothetical protein